MNDEEDHVAEPDVTDDRDQPNARSQTSHEEELEEIPLVAQKHPGGSDEKEASQEKSGSEKSDKDFPLQTQSEAGRAVQQEEQSNQIVPAEITLTQAPIEQDYDMEDVRRQATSGNRFR